jgi:urease accessory protein
LHIKNKHLLHLASRLICYRCFYLVIGIVLAPSSAWAHGVNTIKGGILEGLVHPISGPDHVVAMVAVGLWGAVLGPPALWVLPVAFPMVMAFGGLLGFLGIQIPGVEIGIALSAIVMGIMVAIECKPALWISAVIVSIFAIFHGYAHGSELPTGSNALQFSMGFVITTGILHLIGILLGEARRKPRGIAVVKISGGSIALTGIYFLIRATT